MKEKTHKCNSISIGVRKCLSVYALGCGGGAGGAQGHPQWLQIDRLLSLFACNIERDGDRVRSRGIERERCTGNEREKEGGNWHLN